MKISSLFKLLHGRLTLPSPQKSLRNTTLRTLRYSSRSTEGEFTDRTRGWIEKSEDLFACVDSKLKARQKGPAKTSFHGYRPHL